MGEGGDEAVAGAGAVDVLVAGVVDSKEDVVGALVFSFSFFRLSPAVPLLQLVYFLSTVSAAMLCFHRTSVPILFFEGPCFTFLCICMYWQIRGSAPPE